MREHPNIFDLVEHAAARSATPRLALWQASARGLVEGELPAVNLADCPAPRTGPKMTLGAWLVGFRNAVDRGNDPTSFAHILNSSGSADRTLENGGARSVKATDDGDRGGTARDIRLWIANYLRE